ncbi:MAG: hypothetical protein IJ727_01405 [Treponema sp.]|nr:hypothetical protein [Treponema sp.]
MNLHERDIRYAAKREGALEQAVKDARNYLSMGLSAEQVSRGSNLPIETVLQIQGELKKSS